MSYKQEALVYHEQGRPGKIEVVATKPLTTQRHLSLAYTPGVAEPCLHIEANPEDAYRYTAKGNLVAVISNGTAVLGLGDIGALAGKPVMEGKGNLFKAFADIDVFDIEIDSKDVEEIIMICKRIAPTFGGINLEDIKAPECFEIEQRLIAELDIPVFHDDQHGTAIISGAALLNGLEITGRDISKTRIVMNGAGASSVACARLYVSLGADKKNIAMFDSKGLITVERAKTLNAQKGEFASTESYASLAEGLQGADVFVGLSVANVVTAEMVSGMADRPLIFAMANPDPEIPYDIAKTARPDAIVATGRSDHPNQVNNVLGFPFIFRGALDCRASKINEEMKLAASHALAALAKVDVPDSVLRAYGSEHMQFGPDYIIPKPFDPRVLTWVAPAVASAAADSGVARAPIQDIDAYRDQLRIRIERTHGLMQPLIRRAEVCPPQRIALTDGNAMQVVRAAAILAHEGICIPVLLGNRKRIYEVAEEGRIDLTGIEIEKDEAFDYDSLADSLWEWRRRKGMTRAAAYRLLRADKSWLGATLVRTGLVDGMVGGLGRSYRRTILPAIQVLGTTSHSTVVSGAYAMLFKDKMLFFGDCTVNVDPDAQTLAEIALNTARIAESFGRKPRVAMLSYSDFGEHSHDHQVRRLQEAIEIVRERRPDLEIEGEMQADTAVGWEKMQQHFPFSALTGPANVLIFPNLTSGNVSYKLLRALTDCEAVGPLLVGMGGPVNVIPSHASVNDIVNMAVYTVNQALDRKKATRCF